MRRGTCTEPTSHERRTFNGAVQLALGEDRFRAALQMLETWEIGGLTRARAQLSQSD